MPVVDVVLSVSSDDLLRYYTGTATHVVAPALDGRRIRFPARVLRPYVTEAGVHGTFRLRFDRDNRFVSLQLLR